MVIEKDNLSAPLPEDLRTSEIHYRRLFESARDGILILDALNRKITDVNPFMIEFLGYEREYFLGKELWEIGLLKDEQASITAFLQLQTNNYIRYDDLPLETKNGDCREVEFVSNVYSENGHQVIQCNIRDITERRAAETSMRLMMRAVDSIVEGVLICDALKPDNPLIYTNAAFEHFTGYAHQETEGRNCRFLQGPETDRQTVNEIKNALKAEKSFRGEILNYRKNGTPFWNYLRISPVFNNLGRLTHFVGIMKDINERKTSEESLRRAEAKYRQIVESMPGIVYLAEPTPPFSTIYVSPNVETFGYSTEEWVNRPDMWISIIHDEDRERVIRIIQDAMRQGAETDIEYRIVARDGITHWMHDKGRFVSDEQGNKTGWQGIILDITATKGLEEQLRQAQKLESVGLLAGGIAHDFNNMLTAINGYSELTLRRLEKDDPLRYNIEEIKKAGERSAVLTHQLLAFSRRQVLKPLVVELNEVIADTIKMLHRLIGEDVQLITALNPKVGRVMIDPGQFSQIIMNLALNARDAMPQGGNLTIETANIFLDSSYTNQHLDILPGAYVLLAVSDTGAGMNKETKRHIFEPFFTTKKTGEGTGLGLATVYGIVKQSGGNIEVYSEEGIGTTFKIYLPRVAVQIQEEKVPEISAAMPPGTETILLVEDETLVRNLSREILRECGYTVIEARNGLEALEICNSGDCQFDLLLTDVVMPQMGGRMLAEKLKVTLPTIKILFTSGYTDDAVVRHGVIETNTNFIQKPFTPSDLARKIREILDNH